ncbi:hypothetical protein [Psychroflexus aestuariivivens]|uniref:hypothetical protein n=1 Tax=Psychroflexus aestuariivivens TaxID=1795040 RepID=UPI000FD861EE|nr:hypothetical protein [Psychroflexus aestuariivivens]
MRIIKIALLGVILTTFANCASGYKMIEPKSIDYVSVNEIDQVKLEYKYDLLDKKYAKKETKNDVKLIAIKVTNNSDRDLKFGADLKLTYENGSEIFIMDNEKVFEILKQSPTSYLWYLLLTPINIYTYETNSDGVQETSSTIPVGLILGPGIAGGNMIYANSSNKKFNSELTDYDINGRVIKKGETRYGLIGIRSDSYDSLKLKIQ